MNPSYHSLDRSQAQASSGHQQHGSARQLRRLFVGTFLESCHQSALGLLLQRKAELSELWQRHLSFVKPAKLHLTWVFLGSVPSGYLPELESSLADLRQAAARLTIEYDRAVWWPGDRKARQLVLIPSAPLPEAIAFGQRMRDGLADFVERSGTHTFSPHITILRLKESRKPTGKSVSLRSRDLSDQLSLPGLLPIRQNIDEVCLIESHLGADSDEYQILRRFSFT